MKVEDKNPTPRPLLDKSEAYLLSMLNAHRTLPIKQLQQDILQEICYRFSINTPFLKGSQLALAGKTKHNLKDLKSKLKQQGISVSKNIKDSSHVLINHQLASLEPLKGKTLLLDHQVQELLEEWEPPVWETIDDKIASIEHLADLLFQDQEVLALELIRSLGFVQELIPYAFLALKTTEDNAVKTALRNYLSLQLPSDSLALLHKNYQLKDVEEDSIRKNIIKYTQQKYHYKDGSTVQLDGLQLARILFHYKKTGYSYIWEYGKEQEIKATLAFFIEDQTLDLSCEGIQQLPPELAQFKDLEYVDLSYNERLSKWPAVLLALPKLHGLDLNNTKIKSSPLMKNIPQLQQLQTLALPAVELNLEHLRQWSHLKHLTFSIWTEIKRSPKGEYLTKEEKKQAVKDVLPNCALYW